MVCLFQVLQGKVVGRFEVGHQRTVVAGDEDGTLARGIGLGHLISETGQSHASHYT